MKEHVDTVHMGGSGDDTLCPSVCSVSKLILVRVRNEVVFAVLRYKSRHFSAQVKVQHLLLL